MAQKAIWVHQGRGGTVESDISRSRAVGEPIEVRRRRMAAEIESRIDHLPPFPTVLSELIGLTSSATSAATDLRDCIEKDPVLAGRILRLANSAFYSPRVPVTSIQQAVVMLGHLSVKSLAMAAATLKFFGRDMAAYGMVPGGLWMHSYSVAELARDLAEGQRWEDERRDAVQVGGLLHDIGKIVLDGILPGPGREGQGPEASADEAVEQWEHALTGFTHSGVGRMIAERWRLAPFTADCIGFHHDWADAPADLTRDVALISLADLAARRLGIGLQEKDEAPDRESAALEVVGIPERAFTGIVETWQDKIEDTQELFSNMRGES